ncbi:MAG: 3-methyl-2-oxobutanoate dehydrogenase subunit VorB [Chloroflexota bacterium]|nr:MAG: 3-methyl-2-oxobutanoate dehydrogenase subunit VorB [Chloroflexota bacterium]
MARELLKGNVAIAEAAIRAGLQAYFGYPITPQTELLEHLALRMPQLGRTFLQAESEVAAINMVYGAACAGVRVMTSSSGPGISLMQEGFSYLACSEVPAVIVDIMRGGPGLGNIQPTQADYNQLTKSAGHGDFHCLVLAPSSVQEAIDLTGLAFDLAEKYRTVVIVAGDGLIGQMMEPAELPPLQELRLTRPVWALTGAKGRPKHVITSVYLEAEVLEQVNRRLQAKIERIKADEVRYEAFMTADADVLLVAFGTVARVAKTAIREARREGIHVGLLRPITLYPFPFAPLEKLSRQVQAILVVEMNAGQMVEDVRLGVGDRVPVRFFGHTGGVVPLPDEIVEQIVMLERQLISLDSVLSEPYEPILALRR